MSLNFPEIQKSFAQSFALEAEMLISKEAIIKAIESKIIDMLEWQTEQLFSMLYRLDISEQKLKEVMNNADDVPLEIATLIYNRQCEKIESRLQNNSGEAEEGLAW